MCYQVIANKKNGAPAMGAPFFLRLTVIYQFCEPWQAMFEQVPEVALVADGA